MTASYNQKDPGMRRRVPWQMGDNPNSCTTLNMKAMYSLARLVYIATELTASYPKRLRNLWVPHHTCDSILLDTPLSQFYPISKHKYRTLYWQNSLPTAAPTRDKLWQLIQRGYITKASLSHGVNERDMQHVLVT